MSRLNRVDRDGIYASQPAGTPFVDRGVENDCLTVTVKIPVSGVHYELALSAADADRLGELLLDAAREEWCARCDERLVTRDDHLCTNCGWAEDNRVIA